MRVKEILRVLSCGLHFATFPLISTLWGHDVTGKVMVKVGGIYVGCEWKQFVCSGTEIQISLSS